MVPDLSRLQSFNLLLSTWPRKGLCLFRARFLLFSFLHPAARLLIWLCMAIALQLMSLPLVLLLGCLVLLSGAEVRQHTQRLLRRTRILLATLLLVFAYGLPGSSPWGLNWLPSWDGLAEALLHGSRLVVLLASLAWLLVPLGHQALMAGLWFLLRPLEGLGFPMERSVVRLALVLEYMENMPDRQHWRQWLLQAAPGGCAGADVAGAAEGVDVRAPVILMLPAWRPRDSLVLLSAALVLGGALHAG